MSFVQENAAVHEDMLRELNLYPLWQLRNPVLPSSSSSPMHVAEVVLPPVDNVMDAAEFSPADPAREFSALGWAELKVLVRDCEACDLRAGCSQTVFGSGDANADWMLIGSWPTEDDEASGEPFAGQAGQLLDNMLSAIGLKRNSKVYLTNVVKCCGSIKRGPTPLQIARCLPYLQRQLQLVQPKMLLVLGHAAATALLGEDRAWDSLSGKVLRHAYRDTSGIMHEVPLIVTYHPASLLLTPSNKAQVWKDLCLARNTMSAGI